MTTSHPREERGQAGEGFVPYDAEFAGDRLQRLKRAWSNHVTPDEADHVWLLRMATKGVDALAPATAPQPAGAERVDLGELERLSEAASPGMAFAYMDKFRLRVGPETSSCVGEFVTVAVTSTCDKAHANLVFLAELWNAYRSGALVPASLPAALDSGEGTAGADWHRTEAEARRDNAEIQTLREVCMLQARELKKLDPHGSTPADLDEAMNRLRGVLSASHPQSPSLSEVEAKAVLAEPYLIRKGGYYYRPNRCGYTATPHDAGHYTREEAEAEASIEPWHMSAVKLSDALATLTASQEQDGEVRR